jgi:hypothetical protein
MFEGWRRAWNIGKGGPFITHKQAAVPCSRFQVTSLDLVEGLIPLFRPVIRPDFSLIPGFKLQILLLQFAAQKCEKLLFNGDHSSSVSEAELQADTSAFGSRRRCRFRVEPDRAAYISGVHPS